jgi:hypothetical protein
MNVESYRLKLRRRRLLAPDRPASSEADPLHRERMLDLSAQRREESKSETIESPTETAEASRVEPKATDLPIVTSTSAAGATQ